MVNYYIVIGASDQPVGSYLVALYVVLSPYLPTPRCLSLYQHSEVLRYSHSIAECYDSHNNPQLIILLWASEFKLPMILLVSAHKL